MLIGTSQQGDVLIHTHALADPDVELDLTAERWNLEKNQASVVVGRDVITPGAFGPDGGRKPVGCSIPQADRPLTGAWGVEFFGRKIVRFSDVFTQTAYAQPTNTSLQRLATPYAWPAEMAGGVLVVNADERAQSSFGERRITSITTTAQTNDTLNWSVALAVNQVGDKFHVLYGKVHDKRGVWVTNGRKFWLLQGGVFTQYLDLGAGLEGQRWDMARIGRNMVMFVNEKYPARIIHLDETASGAASTNATLAGLLAPIKPRDVEIPEVLSNNSWLMKALGSGGSMTAGTCRIRVRAVNLDDNAASRFVQVYDEANPTTDYLTVVDSDRVSVWNEPNNSEIAPPPLYERWTHIEVWRTTAAGVDYYLEKRVELARLASEYDADNSVASFTGKTYVRSGEIEEVATGQASDTIRTGDLVAITAPADGADDVPWNWRTGVYTVRMWSLPDNGRLWLTSPIGARKTPTAPFEPIAAQDTVSGVGGKVYRASSLRNLNALVAEQFIECTLADADLTGFSVMGVLDKVAGGPPPMCRKVAGLSAGTFGDTTLCMGKAEGSIVNPTADSRNFYGAEFKVFDASKPRVIYVSAGGGMDFDNYIFQEGDRFLVTRDPGSTGIKLGEHEIQSRVDRYTILLKTAHGASVGGMNIEGHIRRAYEIDWPTIKSDEDVWYSRTDLFAPESFPVRTLQVSTIGDTFRTMVNVGNYVAVLMDSGVHLLFRSGTSLIKDTIAAVGQGTPWEYSVVVVTNTVLWASAEGPKAMTVTTEVASTGMRARIECLGGTAIRQWFRDAYEAGESIDGGVDEVNHCVRWRRKKTDGTYQACQYSYRTGRWTLLDDDNGIAYASTAFAESLAKSSPTLYSIDESGAAFAVNHGDLTHPYDSCTVQAVLDDSYTIWDRKIEKRDLFSPFMLGDVVRFRSSKAAIDGVARVITSATSDNIMFDAVPGLGIGDEFIIGANRFRYRPAPLNGKFPLTVKTLEGLTVRALPGPRNNGADGRFTLRAYREYDDEPVETKEREIEIFDEDDVIHVSEDRVSALQGAGTALEVELEMIESRTDFRLELFEAEVREEGDQVADVSVTE